MRYSDEQQRLIKAEEKIVKGNAFAGTGKTTTLLGRAKHFSRQRMLYITFTRASKEEAQAKFPSNVEVKSTHGLAFATHGVPYRDKIVPGIRPFDVERAGVVDSVKGIRYLEVYAAIEVLKSFLCSDDESITPKHTEGVRVLSLKNLSTNKILDIAKSIWRSMIDPDSQLGMLHDGYLKLYQLSHPDLGCRYAEVMLDEAQDSNPAVLDIVKRSSQRIVLVGDKHQSIYSYRHAVNAMNKVNGAEYYLTQSYRFGDEIASHASILLNSWKQERNKLQGLGDKGFVGHAKDLKETIGKVAYIARTNLALFDRAVDAVSRGFKLYFVGGLQGYRFDDVLDAWYFRQGQRPKTPILRMFGNYDEMIERAKESQDQELLLLHKIVERYAAKIPALIDAIKQAAVSMPVDQGVILTTAHRSKGLQFDSVCLEHGFFDPDSIAMFPSIQIGLEVMQEEINLLYVAITRAERKLWLTKEAFRAILHTPLDIMTKKEVNDA